jgi:2-polyprenyl-6-hydroxyphenyl methylase/3-demethylubiquinone-9 3-methyltransferase
MTTAATTTIDAQEVAQFAAIAAEWWDERGKFAPLHRMNPTRIAYIRGRIEAHFGQAVGASGQDATPLRNLSLLDVGCGGGLICEPMARLGASVTGLDAAPENIAIASEHAKQSGLTINYRATTAEAQADSGAQFDIVLALEIVEHVAQPALFYRALATLVKPGGLLVMSTLNRTAKSYAMAIIGAERILRWLPIGTHDWNKFVKPSEMAESMVQAGLEVVDSTGLTYHPLHGRFQLNPRDLDVNYLITAKKLA